MWWGLALAIVVLLTRANTTMDSVLDPANCNWSLSICVLSAVSIGSLPTRWSCRKIGFWCPPCWFVVLTGYGVVFTVVVYWIISVLISGRIRKQWIYRVSRMFATLSLEQKKCLLWLVPFGCYMHIWRIHTRAWHPIDLYSIKLFNSKCTNTATGHGQIVVRCFVVFLYFVFFFSVYIFF